jgi:protein gp37
MSLRLKAMGQQNYINGFEPSFHERALELPLKWRTPQVVFVNSMSDLFHEEVPVDFICRIFAVMRRANWHCYQILTKRSARLLELNRQIHWMPHVWMGVSVEDQDYVFRIEDLRRTDAHIKFLSLEPLLGPLPQLDLTGVDWVIVGGESGPGSRAMDESWVIDIRNQCIKAGVAFFFKQWGGVNKKRAGRLLEGRTWEEMPKVDHLDEKMGRLD